MGGGGGGGGGRRERESLQRESRSTSLVTSLLQNILCPVQDRFCLLYLFIEFNECAPFLCAQKYFVDWRYIYCCLLILFSLHFTSMCF